MRKKILLLLVLVALILISNASASYNINENFTQIDNKYDAEEIVRGRINMSFSEQENKKFTSNFDGEINLLDLLKNMSYVKGRDYSCNPLSCLNSFKGESNSEQQSFTLNERETKYYGFVLTGGRIISVNSFALNASTNANASCKNQLNIDILNDGTNEIYNRNYLPEPCGEKNYGCFYNNSNSASDVILGTGTQYCELIALPAAPAYQVGATLSASNPSGTIRFSIYSQSWGSALGYNSTVNPAAGEVSVNIPLARSNEFKAYVCVEETLSTSNYKIKAKSGGASCGGFVSGSSFHSGADYEIFARPLKYGAITEMKLGDSGTVNSISQYLERVYGKNCASGCVIPIKFSGDAQDVLLRSGELKYTAQDGIHSENAIYQLSEQDFTINTNYTVFDIAKMKFKSPNINGTQNFELYFNDEKIAEQTVQIKKGFDFDIHPRVVLVGQRATFSADETNITYSEWDFGDGSAKVISSNNQAEHVYLNESSFTVEVKLRKSNSEESKKKFTVVAGELKKSANITLQKYERRISNLKSEISVFPLWIKTKLENAVNIQNAEASVKRLKDGLALLGDNGTDEQYLAIITSLFNLNIPSSISVTESATNIPIEIGFNNMNLNYIKTISGKEIDNEEEVKSAILSWYEENYKAEVNSQVASAFYEESYTKLFTIYKIDITRKPSATAENTYLIFSYPIDKIIFKDSSYDAKPVSNEQGTYISLNADGTPRTAEFLINGSEAPEISALGIYISPSLDELGTTGKPIQEGIFYAEGHFRWGFFLIGLAIIFVFILAIYLLLQTWYKKNYEKHLFKNPNELYNVIYFIYNSRKSGIDDETTKKNLLEKKWTHEQVTYAFKKIDGKRTGMWEIPLFKFAENRKVRQEIEKQQGGMAVDVRFIKRPNFV